ncbi:unnamed protein product [Cylindrotheca closterium]|uniref:Palmitoyltransferase n=1 Tax=Cylindrotheca closterium TaxID=2856 RepID=A0AAD2GAU2_9STRA|nr:unnamed protein product [Cylindrotheca closterium]
MTIKDDSSQLSETPALGGTPVNKEITTTDDVEGQKVTKRKKGNAQHQESSDPREQKLMHWRNSIYAVGRVNIDWKDENPFLSHPPGHKRNDNVAWSGVVCGSCLTCVGRIGNMAVFYSTMEEYEAVEKSEGREDRVVKRKRPRPVCMVGPYWPVNLCLTWPLILGISGWTLFTKVIYQNFVIIITWSLCTFALCASLLLVSCTNPGILYRHEEAPPGEEGSWQWNDQARTYRPSNARFDTECQVVIEEFDHTCPWTGTGIGGGNMKHFKSFVFMVPVCIIYTVVLHMGFT